MARINRNAQKAKSVLAASPSAPVQEEGSVVFSNLWVHLTALLFAFFMVFGPAFYEENSWDLVVNDFSSQLAALIQGLCWYGLFFWGIRWLFQKLDLHIFGKTCLFPKNDPAPKNAPQKAIWLPKWLKKPAQAYLEQLKRRPRLTAFCTLILFHLPYIAVSYPAIFMGDGWAQFSQVTGRDGLSSHHPVTHTLFLSLFYHIGKALGNVNLGMFLCGLTQTLLVCGAIAYAIGVLAENKHRLWLLLGVIAYACIHPRISAYFFLMSKDVVYSAFLLLFYVLLYGRIRTKQHTKCETVLFFSAIAGTMLFRNDGKFVVLLTFLAGALLLKSQRKQWLSYFGIALAFILAVEKVAFPLLQVEPGSIREMLSVPFQQTARFVRDAEEDIRPEEREVIDRVLDYDALAECYNPNLSDPVKATYHGNGEDLVDYFRVWGKMLIRRPSIYLQATMNNYYQYFYPGPKLFSNYSYSWSQTIMEELNGLGLELQQPAALSDAAADLEDFREKLFSQPILSLLMKPALYTWTALLAIAYVLRRKSRVGLLYCLPMLVQLLIFITGPTNGAYCRYEYPMFLYLPVVLTLGVQLLRNEKTIR